MNDGPGLDLLELRRRLTDLAESVEAEQPWDDPMPHVLGALRATESVEYEPRPRRNPGPFTVVRGRLSRISRPSLTWPHLNPVPIISVAAAFLVVAVIVVLLRGGAGGADTKQASGGTVANAAGGLAATSQTQAGGGKAPGSSGPGPVPRASACGSVPASPRIVLTAPAELVPGGVIRVQVRLSGGLRLTSPTVLVRSGVDVVGRLVPTERTPTPTGPRSAGSFALTGRLVRTSPSCGDLPGNTVPGPVRSPASLPAGRYVLVVTGSTGAGRVASAPVAVTIHR